MIFQVKLTTFQFFLEIFYHHSNHFLVNMGNIVGNIDKIDVNVKTKDNIYGNNVTGKMTYAEALKNKKRNMLCKSEKIVLTNLN